jgi:Protein of unknown function (DUF1552)
MVWRDEHTPLPMESNPRNVFERLFGDSGTTAPAVRNARLKKDSSLLDSVVGRVAELQRNLGPSDRTKIDRYLEAVRDVERRIQKTKEQSSQDLPSLDQPAGVPATVREHAKLMFDLQTVAYQTDLTRIVTFMIGREITGRTYPDIGVPHTTPFRIIRAIARRLRRLQRSITSTRRCSRSSCSTRARPRMATGRCWTM